MLEEYYVLVTSIPIVKIMFTQFYLGCIYTFARKVLSASCAAVYVCMNNLKVAVFGFSPHAHGAGVFAKRKALFHT